ncbi:hypothetical protein AK830_g1002 [Neonectria ditissima]|uniref:Protamine P1 n=1 Tax=Neonectria ditissima TaxID=78410 RepID=A0A0P7BXQ1_9HYPO|nr:hypothetical protein AK830_g1002 [Neonectria ditissima]
MQHADRKVDELGPSWEEDTIYCEATCAPKDVFYEGSDDEDYDDPTCRRLRYEAVGQRFLDGCTPLLLTATLKGPFEKSSGWINPWQSKHRTARTFQGTRSSPKKLSRQSKHERNMSVPETLQVGPHDSMECHLPSPESLKQAPVAEEHPYLEDDELDMVEKWRTTVQPVAKDQFWVSTPKGSENKRKATGSEWLRKVASKRRRTELMESGSINSPIPQMPVMSHRDRSSGYLGRSISFTSVPDQLPSSANAAKRFLRNQTIQDIGQDAAHAENDDEVVDSITVSFASAPDRLQSPAKRSSPKRTPKRSTRNEVAKTSRNYLLQNEAASIKAAATLSSPVSQQRFPQASTRKSPRLNSSQRIQGKPSPTRSSPSLQQAKTVREKILKGYKSVEARELETQRDDSFCFRMQSRPTVSANDRASAVDQATASSGEACEFDDVESWSGLSSMDDEEVEQLRVADDDIETKVSRSKTVAMSADSESEPMQVDRNTVSSELSSLASEDFAGFDIAVPSEANVEMEDDSTTSSGSETASNGSSSESSDTTEVAVVETSQPMVQQDIPDNEQTSEIHVATPKERSVPDDGAAEEDASDQSEDESDQDDTDGTSSQASDASDLAPAAPADLCKSAPLHLLKDSVKRLVPKTLWARLSHSSSPAPMPDRETNEPSHCKTVLEEGLRETSTAKEKLDELSPGRPTQIAAPERQYPSITSQPSEHGQAVVGLDYSIETDKADLDAEPLPVSQQSSWAENKLSQFTKLAENGRSQDNSPVTSTPQMVDDASTTGASVITTPQLANFPRETVATQDDTPNVDAVVQLSALHPPVTTSSTSSQMQNHGVTPITPAITPAMALRPSTPEPQFSVKSFASFMSPSPERRSRKSVRAAWRDSGSRLPSTQGIIASATKNPWKADVSQRRVSWAPLPHELSASITSVTMPRPLEVRGRQVSPPPTTPVADLPTSGDAKFHEHFTAVANRTKSIRQRILPTASQCTLGSPEPQAMAETFLCADQFRKPDNEDQGEINASSQHEPTHDQESQEPLDIVEDVIREMGGYLDAWDVDLELDQARKSASMQTPQLTQSPW